ncbi:hypothetical protein [Streptomyces sp. NPDC090022]|uniref:hypothetical protein n=1 Tax=Streptomyces sp. NPDC090022 TaxID=3365920 RepID=UPI00381CFA8E
MGGTFWEGVGGKLAERFASASAHALLFWLGGLLAWLSTHGGLAALHPSTGWFQERSGAAQAAVLVVVLAVVAGSAVLVERLVPPALAVLEGHWGRWLRPLAARLVVRRTARAERLVRRFQELAGPVHDGTATARERDEYTRVSRAFRRLPTGDRLLPTRVGNILRAAETRPVDKYGLDAVALWPHLWLLLPDTARDELAAARRALDSSVAAALWGLLFVAFTPWGWWALPVGLVAAAAAVSVWVPARAEAFADLVEAAFDLYHPVLYRQLRWPLPAHPDADRAEGRRVSTYLTRGLTGTTPAFTDD